MKEPLISPSSRRSNSRSYSSEVVSLPRALSKQGICSRTQAEELIRSGQITVNGRVQRSPSFRVNLKTARISMGGQSIIAAEKVYLVLNKPRGLITTRQDEKARDTIYRCLESDRLPWVFPVGRLDKASEGLLLLTNDTHWAAGLLNPASHVEKCYHVQVSPAVSPDRLAEIRKQACGPGWKELSAVSIELLRTGSKNCWLKIVLDEGKNRHIRRLLDSFNLAVLRLVRVSIGPLSLGKLAKGEFRTLTQIEIQSLSVHRVPKIQPQP